MLKIKKLYLIIIAGIVWMFAGFNVFFMGAKLYTSSHIIIKLLISFVVFFLFIYFIFSNLVTKHIARIKTYSEKEHILKFFDKNSYILMICMMTFGISIRKLHILPNTFISVFYCGLGLALFLAGVLFIYNFIKVNFFQKILD